MKNDMVLLRPFLDSPYASLLNSFYHIPVCHISPTPKDDADALDDTETKDDADPELDQASPDVDLDANLQFGKWQAGSYGEMTMANLCIAKSPRMNKVTWCAK